MLWQIAFAATLCVAPAFSSDIEPGPLRLMSPQTFASAGLSKLSPAELTELANWISAYATVMVKQTATVSGTSGVVETRIDGEFDGWDDDKIYKMQNGQIWQQSSYHYHYHYAYSPEVLIYPSNGGYKIHVHDDDDEDVSVRRLK